MFKLIISDIKSLIKRPLLFILMFLGIAAGAFSLLVYYSLGSNSLYLGKNWANQNRVIEFSDEVYTAGDHQAILSLIQDGSLPEINYASISSYDSNNYDIIGLYYNNDNSSLKSGELINITHMGEMVTTVSSDIFEENIAPGDAVKIKGIPFTVVGVFYPNEYNPLTYDIRRVSSGQGFLAGADLIPSDLDFTGRPNKAVIVPFDAVDDICVDLNYFHICFTEPLSKTERAEVEEKLWNAVGGCNFTDLNNYVDIIDNNGISETVAYIVAIVAGLVNIITLFAYFLKENKKTYETYRLLGASPLKLFAICILELLLFTLFAFLIGVSGAIPFIERSGFFNNYRSIEGIEIILVYFALVLFQFTISFKIIYEIAFGRKITISKKIIGERKLLLSKKLTIIGYRYSPTRIIHTISISLLALVITFVLTFGFIYIFDSEKYSRYIEKNFNCCISAFSPILEIEADNGINNTDIYADIEKQLNSLENIYGVGKVSSGKFAWTKEDTADLELEIDKIVYLRNVNNNFIEFSPLPLEKGNWDKLINYDKNNETSSIPCVIPKAMEKRFPLNSQFELDIEVLNKDGEIAKISREFIVVGIAKEDSLRPTHSFADEGNPNITGYLLPYKVSSQIRPNGVAIIQELFIPDILIDGAIPNYSLNSTYTYYLYSEDYSSLPLWREEIIKYGTIFAFSDLADNYKYIYNESGGNIYLVHAVVATLLLIIGIGGYNLMFFATMKKDYGIYYIHGMPWKDAIFVTLFGNAIDMLLPGIIGVCIGIITAQKIRAFTLDSVYYSGIVGYGVVVAVFVVTSVVVSILLKKYSPKKLLND